MQAQETVDRTYMGIGLLLLLFLIEIETCLACLVPC